VRIVVTGYASLDFAVRLDRPPRADATATIVSRPRQWPRLGGSPAYVAAALIASGLEDVAPVSWVGDDADGVRYREALARAGVRSDGVSVRPGRTPVCILAYQPDGGCHCLYDPGLVDPPELDETQRALIVAANCLCVTVGPAQATRDALSLARPDATVVWAVKADPRAVPPDLAVALMERADIVVFSRGEAAFVAEAFARTPSSRRPGVRVETLGRDGVAIMQARTRELFPVAPVETEDSTGAGDTFLGGFLGALIVGGESPREAVQAGIESARRLLASRAESDKRG
jgi:ribokinase